MPVIPSVLERILMSRGFAPPFLIDMVNAAGLRAFGAARDLDLLAPLADRPASAAALAAATGADPVSVDRLLDVLARTGYVRRTNGAYALSPAADRWLRQGGVTAFVEHWHNVLFEHFDSLAPSVQAGAPRPHLHEWLSASGHWATFNAAMAELASASADEVARTAALPPPARSLADLGGSHGLNAAAFCRRYPALHATVLDLPESLSQKRTLDPAVADRVIFRAADVTRDELGGPYDAILVFQLLHYFRPEANASLLRRVRSALAPSGRVLILDQLRGAAPTPVASAFFAVLALTYRTGLGGDLYGYDEIAAWLHEAGFSDVRRRSIRSAPGNALISATV